MPGSRCSDGFPEVEGLLTNTGMLTEGSKQAIIQAKKDANENSIL